MEANAQLSEETPETERLNYAVQCKGVDFGMLNARNQLVSKVINPLIDKLMLPLKKDRALRGGTGSGQRFTVSIIVTAERDVDTVQ
jgi:hypothetical protein